ncbi:hypothetical protein GNP61_19340 [Aliivibrio fischeri]|uniref:hypothetical protein n=1 Tax=Aliivibrio fischeri TaxID=668 RepID=UPI0012DA2AC9|nr:hypothetical protein [Aliivibrio fischeri]MUK43705.1 hypothetical protein [Aliivibrio fischeri]
MKEIFKIASICSWELLRKSKKYGSRIGEETITELLQLYLSHHSGQLLVKSFTKHQESKTVLIGIGGLLVKVKNYF